MGILQVRILEWVSMPSSRGSSQPRDHTCILWVSCIAGRFFFFFFLPLSHWGSPIIALLPCKKDNFIRFSKECKSFWNFLYSPLNLLKFSQRRNRISFEDRIRSEPWRRNQMCVGLNWAPTSGISGAVSDGQQRFKGDSGFLGLLKPCLQMAVYT